MNINISHNFYGAPITTSSQDNLMQNLVYDFRNFCVIVVDVLRASTTITTLLEICNEIYITDSIEDIEFNHNSNNSNINNNSNNNSNNFVKIGERNGKKIEDFDFGNSPFEIRLNKDYIISQINNGKDILLTTTNGTRILKSILSDNILMGSITNAKYVAEVAYNMAKENKKDILIIPCHRKGTFAIEDYVGAGIITKYILKHLNETKPYYNEELIPVLNLVKSDWKSLIFNGSSANNLKNLGYSKDLIFCTSENIQKTVGIYKSGKIVKY
ncbi:2-phosphosulfolactate phosphatase [Methanothermococcus okinawensis]|uniref:2-phosphosulfolactate phosphatase n=1 Tax=Methanothermococcus okinawensis TaxID=155863 RepID=UPI00064F43CE|nr:2-phosphosulfolactate phosphatase [Methanothermococcus okinawensis]